MEVYKEAHLLAFQIQSNSRTTVAQAAQPEDPGSQGGEGFIQESKLKINLFDRENEVKKSPKSLKRETYCLSDDLWRAPLLRGTQPASSAAPPAAPAQTGCPETLGPPPTSCPSLPAEPSAAQPLNQAGAQKKVTSKLLPPRTSSLRAKSLHSAVEKVAPPAPPALLFGDQTWPCFRALWVYAPEQTTVGEAWGCLAWREGSEMLEWEVQKELCPWRGEPGRGGTGRAGSLSW